MSDDDTTICPEDSAIVMLGLRNDVSLEQPRLA